MWRFQAAAALAWSPSVPPSYPHFPGRHVYVLNGTWDFAFLGDVELEAVADAVALQHVEWEEVEVPDAFDLRPDTPDCSCFPNAFACDRCCDRSLGHRGDPQCWGDERRLEGVWLYQENEDSQAKYELCCGVHRLRHRRGVALYHTRLPPGAGLLSFGACAFRCVVALDGTVLEDHSGLSPFEVEVPGGEREQRELLVMVDNRFRESHPVHQAKYDWYQAGGLLRPVQFHQFISNQLLYIKSVQVLPRSLQSVDIKLEASAITGVSFRYCFDSCLEDWPLELEGLQNVRVPGARPWSVESPALHHLTVTMSNSKGILDQVELRFGLRLVTAENAELRLNGEPLKLLGFNRHDLAESPVMTYELLVRDVELLLEMGVNFVRGAHYAQDQRFLDLCDIHGLLVWEEVLGWQNTVEDFLNPTFVSQSLRMAKEMAMASAHHPSVIFLGFFNEGESFDDSEATTAIYRAMAQQLRRHSGGTRLIGYGSNHPGEDKQLPAVDVHAFHLYLAWYPTTQPADAEEVHRIPELWEQVRQWSTHIADKPVLITEAGAGGLFGFRGPVEKKWTEEYQALLLKTHLEAIIENPGIAGISLWQFADIPIDRRVSDEQHRPRGLNNKGVLSTRRLPKLSAMVVSQIIRNFRAG